LVRRLGEFVVIVSGVQNASDANLPQMAQTRRRLGPSGRSPQGGQNHAREQRNHRHNHQQLDQSKRPFRSSSFLGRPNPHARAIPDNYINGRCDGLTHHQEITTSHEPIV
jgi:hypothetical protein